MLKVNKRDMENSYEIIGSNFCEKHWGRPFALGINTASLEDRE